MGLFGTVWGIMNAFIGLSNVSQATLAQVAPGIAEALIATAIGLFAAIPAVIAYNRFTHDIDRLANRYDVFMEEFSNILSRRPSGHDPPPPRKAIEPDQRGALHRRDAGAAGDLHGHSPFINPCPGGAAQRQQEQAAAPVAPGSPGGKMAHYAA